MVCADVLRYFQALDSAKQKLKIIVTKSKCVKKYENAQLKYQG
jgi:hypothetical protein